MRKELLERLLEIFEEDKEVIIKNLILTRDEVSLVASNEYEKARLTIKIERKGSVKNEYMGKSKKKKGAN